MYYVFDLLNHISWQARQLMLLKSQYTFSYLYTYIISHRGKYRTINPCSNRVNTNTYPVMKKVNPPTCFIIVSAIIVRLWNFTFQNLKLIFALNSFSVSAKEQGLRTNEVSQSSGPSELIMVTSYIIALKYFNSIAILLHWNSKKFQINGEKLCHSIFVQFIYFNVVQIVPPLEQIRTMFGE